MCKLLQMDNGVCRTRLRRVLLWPGFRSCTLFLAVLSIFVLSGCASHEKDLSLNGAQYVVTDNTYHDDLLNIFAPVFVLPEWRVPHNRIGMAVAEVLR